MFENNKKSLKWDISGDYCILSICSIFVEKIKIKINRTKISGKYQYWKIQMRHYGWFLITVDKASWPFFGIYIHMKGLLHISNILSKLIWVHHGTTQVDVVTRDHETIQTICLASTLSSVFTTAETLGFSILTSLAKLLFSSDVIRFVFV